MKIGVVLERRVMGQAVMEVPDEFIEGLTKKGMYGRFKKEAIKAFKAGHLDVEWDEDAEEFVADTWLYNFCVIDIGKDNKIHVLNE